jgi:hypothetical protein
MWLRARAMPRKVGSDFRGCFSLPHTAGLGNAAVLFVCPIK